MLLGSTTIFGSLNHVLIRDDIASLNFKKINTLMKQIHVSWCPILILLHQIKYT